MSAGVGNWDERVSGEGLRGEDLCALLEEGLQWCSAAELGMRLGVGLGGAEEEEGVLLAFLIVCLVRIRECL